MTTIQLAGDDDEKLLTVKTVCDRLGLSKAKVYELMDEGLILYVKPLGVRGRRVKSSELARYISRARKGGES